MKPKTIFTATFAALSFFVMGTKSDVAVAQDSRPQNLYFLPKSASRPEFRHQDYLPGKKKAFYLYRNCAYIFVLNDGKILHAKVEDIRDDSIYYTYYWDSEFDPTNTFSIHPSTLKEIVIPSVTMKTGNYTHILMRKRRFVFQTTDDPKVLPESNQPNYKYGFDGKLYTLVQGVTSLGLDGIYALDISDTSSSIHSNTFNDPKRRNRYREGLWFTPSTASSISGVNIGILTFPMWSDSLVIRGLNLAADPVSYFIGVIQLFNFVWNNSQVDTGDDTPGSRKTKHTTKRNDHMHGVSLSLGGLYGEFHIQGLSVNGLICTAASAKGVVLSGDQNEIKEFQGLMASFFYNKSFHGKGAQVGLINICTKFRGFQIGLWNVNSKRRLPFINWG